MKMLIACECSGIVRDAFGKKGHESWSCDIKESETPTDRHYKCDVRYVLSYDWNFIGAHPECRYLTVSGMHRTVRGLRDPKLTEDAIAFCELIWNSIKRVGKGYLENSIGVLSTRSSLGKPSQIIQPYDFGHDASKSTCLWLHGLPPLIPTKRISPRFVCGKCFTELPEYYFGNDYCHKCKCEPSKLLPRWSNQTNSGQNRLAPSETRSADRARTYSGIAAAMAEQWG